MTDTATWLMALSVAGPLVGAVVGLILVAGKPMHRAAAASANLGILCSAVSAASLAVVLGPVNSAILRVGTWLELTSPRRIQIDWTLQADLAAALWVAVLSGLAGMTVWSFNRAKSERPMAAFSVTTAMVLASTNGFVLSASLVPMFTCWTALSVITLAMVAWSSLRGSSVQGMRRAVQVGLPGDILLLWVFLSIVQSTGSNSLADAMSPDGLAQLGTGNLAFPGLVGSLLVLSILGRCGLFPFLGWHQQAATWESRLCIVIYGIGYVPSAIWMVLKCQPLLATSEVPLALLGGLGTLGAVLAAFVACGQSDPQRRLAYLLTSQVGVMLAALGSGSNESVSACVIHQCSLSIAAFVLFTCSSEGFTGDRIARIAAWCAALSIAGVIPLSGGWSQQALIEMNLHQHSAKSVLEVSSTTEIGAEVSPSDVDPLKAVPGSAVPPWGWICGMWIAQSLSAYGAVRLVSSEIKRTWSFVERNSACRNRLVELAAILLLLGGPCGWMLSFIHFPTESEAMSRLLVGQSAAMVGLLAGWRAQWMSQANELTPTNRCGSISRLSQQGLYVDQVFYNVFKWPDRFAQFLATRILSSTAIDASWSWLTVRIAALFGNQVESLHVGQADFYVATILLGTVTLLLTLILVA